VEPIVSNLPAAGWAKIGLRAVGYPSRVSRKGKDKFPNSGITGIVWRLQRHWPEAVPMCAVWDCEPRHPKGDRNTPHRWWGMGGGAAILKQATAALAARAARRSGPERNPADYPGIKVNLSISRGRRTR